MLENANKIRFLNVKKNLFFLYETINEFSGLTVYDLAKKVGWTTGKVNHYVQKLVKDGVIKNSTEIENGRPKKKFSSVDFKKIIKWDEMGFQ